MEPISRQRALNVLLKYRPDIAFCRNVEAYIHSVSESEVEYNDMLSRTCYNIHVNNSLTDAASAVHESDNVLAKGTNLERIELQRSQLRKNNGCTVKKDRI